MGVLPDRLPGHTPIDDEAARQRLSQLWGGDLPVAPGKTYSQMLDTAGNEIRALLVMGANPASERPAWAGNLGKLDLLVVQELFLTETAAQAHVVLPAVSWAEADGTFTNLERRIQRAPRALRNPESKAAPDWMILDHMANRLGVNWPYADERAILHEIAEAAPIYAGLTWAALGDQGVQWDAASVRQEWAGALAARPVTQAEPPRSDGSQTRAFALVTGTALYDGGSMFYRTEHMRSRAWVAMVGMHPDDATRLGIAEGAAVIVRSDGGEIELTAKLDSTVRPGTVWIPESSNPPGAGGSPLGAMGGLPGVGSYTVDIAAKK